MQKITQLIPFEIINVILLQKPNDRRGDYLLLREKLLNSYYPQRNKTLNPA